MKLATNRLNMLALLLLAAMALASAGCFSDHGDRDRDGDRHDDRHENHDDHHDEDHGHP